MKFRTPQGRWLCLSLVAAVCGVAACSDSTGVDPFPGCFITAPHTFGGQSSGSLASGACVLQAGDLPGTRYVSYYTLRLGSESQVTIDLESTQFDAYLYLWTAAGRELARDDDSGMGIDARVSVVLNAGEYIIGVTSYEPNGVGAFDLFSYVTPTHFQGCGIIGTHTIGTTNTGSITTNSCRARPQWTLWEEMLGDFYFLRLNRARRIRIDMEASLDSFLILMNANTGAVVAWDDDGGGYPNARISGTVPAGDYVIVATSFMGNRTGGYTMRSTIW